MRRRNIGQRFMQRRRRNFLIPNNEQQENHNDYHFLNSLVNDSQSESSSSSSGSSFDSHSNSSQQVSSSNSSAIFGRQQGITSPPRFQWTSTLLNDPASSHERSASTLSSNLRPQSRMQLFRRMLNNQPPTRPLQQLRRNQSRPHLIPNLSLRRRRRLDSIWEDSLTPAERQLLIMGEDSDNVSSDNYVINIQNDEDDIIVEIRDALNRNRQNQELSESEADFIANSNNEVRQNVDDESEEIFDYDSDWSEVEQILKNTEEFSSIGDLEEPLINEIFQGFGTLALVFYKRVKDQKLLEDKDFADVVVELSSKLTLEMDINHFICDIMNKIVQCISKIKASEKYIKKEKKEVTKCFEILQKILNLFPNNKLLEKTLNKYCSKMNDLKDKIPEKTIIEILILKLILDIKIKLHSIMESPYYSTLSKEIIPMAIKLHKEMTKDIVEKLNSELKVVPWSQYLQKKLMRNSNALISFEKTRKGYINNYEQLLQEYEDRNVSTKRVIKQKNKVQKKYNPHSLVTIL